MKLENILNAVIVNLFLAIVNTHEMCHAKYSTWLYIYIFLINMNVNKRETLIKTNSIVRIIINNINIKVHLLIVYFLCCNDFLLLISSLNIILPSIRFLTWLYIYIFLININVNKRETLIKQIGYNQVSYKIYRKKYLSVGKTSQILPLSE
jgi:uncharacterized protein YacL